MDVNEFRKFAKAAIDYIADYHETLRDRQVLPDVEPGYIRDLLPEEAPTMPQPWQEFLGDFDKIVMPGLTHWQSPNFYAYYPASFSFPSLIADIISSGLGVVGINWITGPAITELEVVMMDWLGKLLDLPEEFLNCTEGPGGGVIKGTASEATLVCLLAAKERTVKKVKKLYPEMPDAEIKEKLRGYSSDQSNSSIEKAGRLGSMMMHLLPSDEIGRLDPNQLRAAIKEDLQRGFFPCYAVMTLGTTGTCVFDDLQLLGPICEEADIWMHVDAAYAGAAFACPEYRHLKNGLEYAQSFNFNAHKFLLVNFDCAALWVKNAGFLMDAFTVERPYLQHEYQDTAPEYLHWQIPLGRRLRSLKIWFVLRSYGVEGIRSYIRRQVSLAKYLSNMIQEDARFEVCSCNLALVCFRLRGDDSLTETLLKKLTERKKIYLLSYFDKKKTVIRVSMNSNYLTEKDVEEAWKEIQEQTEVLLVDCKFESIKELDYAIRPKETRFNMEEHLKIEKVQI